MTPADSKHASLPKRPLLILVVVAIAYALNFLSPEGLGTLPAGTATSVEAPASGLDVYAEGMARVAEAFAAQESDVIVSLEGEVVKTLPDDNEGSRHQKFIVELADGATVLVAHNIDLAPRVPLREGDVVQLHGEYEWNDRGGVMHWTHHDPKGWHEDGWIRHEGQTYR